jgi:two-component system, chemotaxis family, CheB/CheR fusion protein
VRELASVQEDLETSEYPQFMAPPAGLATSSEDGRLWRDLVNALPAAIYLTDAAGRIIFCNETAVILWGCRPELGKSEFCGSWKLYWPDGTPLPHDQCPMALALKEKRPIRGMEAIAERPDGTRVHFIPYPTPLFDASDNLIGAVNMLVDITERKRAEEVAQRLASIVESSDDAILSKNLDGIITSWNQGAERLFGYSSDEMVGKSVTLLIPADRQDEEPKILGRIRRGERMEHYETVRLRKDGSLIDISLSVSPIRDAGGKIIGASKIARDITERKQAQARQEMLTRELHHRTKNLFAVVQSVVSRSFTGKRTVKDAETAVKNRLRSLAQTHALLVEKNWSGADLAAVVRTEMSPYPDRVTIDGPTMMLSSQAAQNFALAVHELATNAAKYGALSNQTGWVHISWSVLQANGESQFSFRWQEQNGPPVEPPTIKGFGAVVLEQVMAEYFAVPPKIEFAPSGVCYELKGPVEAVVMKLH